jgi:hypothetical protein
MSNATQALGNRSDIALSTASLMANQAEDIVWNAIPHDSKDGLATSSTTSGENRITLPSDFAALLNVSNLSSSGYDLMGVWNIDDVDSSGTGRGIPTNFIRYSDWLELWPSPDSSYSIQIRYEKQRPEMTATNAVPSVGTRYRYAVYLKTRELLADIMRDRDGATVARNEYISYMMSTPSDSAYRQRTREGMTLRVRRTGDNR